MTKIEVDFKAAREESNDEKSESVHNTDNHLFSDELIGTIDRATRTKTPHEASQYAFQYLRDIVYKAPNVSPDGPQRAFTDKWIDEWAGFINDWDFAVHVLTNLAYRMEAQDFQGDEDFEYEKMEVRKHIRDAVQKNARVGDWLQDLGVWDGVYNTLTDLEWVHHNTGEERGKDNFYRTRLFTFLQGTTEERAVRGWVENLERFMSIVVKAFIDLGNGSLMHMITRIQPKQILKLMRSRGGRLI